MKPTPTARHADAVSRPGAGTLGVLVVDDSAVFRAGLCRAVEAHADMRLVGHAHDGESALTAIAELKPDLVLLDLRMPGLDGIGVLRRLAASDPPPPCRVVVVSATLDEPARTEALAAGADGCLSKALSRTEICAAALAIARR